MVLLVVEEDWRGWPREKGEKKCKRGVGGIRTHYLKVAAEEEEGGGGVLCWREKLSLEEEEECWVSRSKLGREETLFSPLLPSLFSPPPISLLSLLPSASPHALSGKRRTRVSCCRI